MRPDAYYAEKQIELMSSTRAVAIDRVPPTAQLTTSDDDEDFPAIARREDQIRMAIAAVMG